MKERKCSQLYFLFGATSVLEQLAGPLPCLMSSSVMSSFLPAKGETGWPAEALLPQSGTRVHHGLSQLGTGLSIVFKCGSSTDEVVSLFSPLHRHEGMAELWDLEKRGISRKASSSSSLVVVVFYCHQCQDN